MNDSLILASPSAPIPLSTKFSAVNVLFIFNVKNNTNSKK